MVFFLNIDIISNYFFILGETEICTKMVPGERSGQRELAGSTGTGPIHLPSQKSHQGIIA